MIQESGNVSVSTENIFPIIRKWLYSDRDIFLRELVSNAADANSKLKRLGDIGEFERPENDTLFIRVEFDSAAGTLSIEDNGIGMTVEEIRKYINQIAFSGVMDFVEKYQDKGASGGGIIGHFGLGFYSAFMVADKVRIDTLSYQAGAEAASWESEDGMAYVMGPSDRKTRGSLITLTLSDEGKEFLTGAKIREILEKYCSYMSYPIYFSDIEADKKREEQAAEAAAKKAAAADSKDQVGDDQDIADELADPDIGADASAKEKTGPQPINDLAPLWLKNPRDCTDEEYKTFYRRTFKDYREPLFLDPFEYGLSLQFEGDPLFPQNGQRL